MTYKIEEYEIENILTKDLNSSNGFENFKENIIKEEENFAITTKINDKTYFNCSCGHISCFDKYDKNRHSTEFCPECGVDVYEIYEIGEPQLMFRKVFWEQLNDSFILHIEEYDSTFDLKSLTINLERKVELKFNNDFSFVEVNELYELMNLSNELHLDIEKFNSIISHFLPELAKNIDMSYEFRDAVLYIYFATLYPAFKFEDVLKSRILKNLLSDALYYPSIHKLDKVKLNLNGTSLSEVYGVPEEIIPNLSNMSKLEEFYTFKDFYEKCKEEGVSTYVENYLKENVITQKCCESIKNSYEEIKDEVEFSMFIRYIFSSCSANYSIVSAIYEYRYVKENCQGIISIDYTKVFKSYYYKKIKSIISLEKGNIMNRERYVDILKKPSLSAFLKVTS